MRNKKNSTGKNFMCSNLIATALLFMTMFTNSHAQNSITLTLADGVSYFKVTTADVNLRKSPNANSGKLMEWNSDAGSYETETILYFSDENKGRYKADNLTGAYITTVHPGVGQIYQIEGESGDWYKIKENEKDVWLMKKFGKKIDVGIGSWGGKCPIDIGYDEYGNHQAADLKLLSTFNRKTGKYKNLKFTCVVSEGHNGDDTFDTHVTFLFPINDKYLCTYTCDLDTRTQANLTKPSIVLKKEIEYGMDGEEEVTNMYFHVKKTTKTERANVALNALLSMSETDFGKILEKINIDYMDTWIHSTNGEVINLGSEPLNKKATNTVSQTFKFVQ